MAYYYNKLALYGTGGRLLLTANFKVSQKLRQKSGPNKLLVLCPNLRIRGHLPAPIMNGGGDGLWNGRISDFQGLVTLTWPWIGLHCIPSCITHRPLPTLCLKKTTLLWLAITSTCINRFWYFLAGLLPRKWEVKWYFICPPHLTSAAALPGKTRKHENRIFITQMLYYCFSRVHPIAAWFLQFCWLETHIVADTDSLNLIINWVQLWPVGGL